MTSLGEKVAEVLGAIYRGGLAGRGRPNALDRRMALAGWLPASVAAQLAGRHISRVYAAGEAGKLKLRTEGGRYRYVERASLVRWVEERAERATRRSS